MEAESEEAKKKISKVLHTVTLYSKDTRALTFKNFCQRERRQRSAAATSVRSLMHLPTHPERKDIGVDAFMCVCVCLCVWVGGCVCTYMTRVRQYVNVRELERESVCVCAYESQYDTHIRALNNAAVHTA